MSEQKGNNGNRGDRIVKTEWDNRGEEERERESVCVCACERE